jgi:DNA polymerase-3 subunit alpha
MKEGMLVVLGGIIEGTKHVATKNNETMAFVNMSDLTGSIEIVVFPKIFAEFKNLLNSDKVVLVRGRISRRNDSVSVIAEKFKILES